VNVIRLLAPAAAIAAAFALVPAGTSAGAPARIQVVEKEYTLTLSRLRVRHGTAIVQVIDFGMDDHDLVIQRNGKGGKPIHFNRLTPNARETRMLQLPAGHYTLWCSLPGHRALGMVAPLTVS